MSLAGQPAAAAESWVQGLTADHRTVDLTAADRAMLDYAIQLTQAPHATTATDVDRLREAGFDDRAIHDICAVTSYYAFVNRVADGLGVDLEDHMRP